METIKTWGERVPLYPTDTEVMNSMEAEIIDLRDALAKQADAALVEMQGEELAFMRWFADNGGPYGSYKDAQDVFQAGYRAALAQRVVSSSPSAPCEAVPVAVGERIAFEADTLEIFPVATFGRFPTSGRYNIDWVQNRWEGWQARATLAAAPQPTDANKRYSWLRDYQKDIGMELLAAIEQGGAVMDAAIDAAIAASAKEPK